MTFLTVTERGQVTFRKELMQHFGLKPGDKIEVSLLPNGEGLIRAAKPQGTFQSVFGLLANQTTKVATIEQINEAIAAGWAGETPSMSSKYTKATTKSTAKSPSKTRKAA
jgi:bifunctional DNA-binding transcriptional regulator/antitoxin component of YhaV-PrlF toxin-antitoxin module